MASVDVTVNISDIINNVETAIDDDVMLAVHNTFAKLINPWVPFREGVLSQDIEITPNYIRYISPYAHYQYVGMVYGPNIPIYENGDIVGWFSPPGRKKHPTGKPIQYGTEFHPLATKEWDKVAMQTQLDNFVESVKAIILRKINENG